MGQRDAAGGETRRSTHHSRLHGCDSGPEKLLHGATLLGPSALSLVDHTLFVADSSVLWLDGLGTSHLVRVVNRSLLIQFLHLIIFSLALEIKDTLSPRSSSFIFWFTTPCFTRLFPDSARFCIIIRSNVSSLSFQPLILLYHYHNQHQSPG